MKTLIFAPAADIPRSSQNARPRRGYGGDSGDNPGRKSGRFLKTSGSGLHRHTDIRTHKRRDIGWPFPRPRGRFAWRNRHRLCKTETATRDFAVPLPWRLPAPVSCAEAVWPFAFVLSCDHILSNSLRPRIFQNTGSSSQGSHAAS